MWHIVKFHSSLIILWSFWTLTLQLFYLFANWLGKTIWLTAETECLQMPPQKVHSRKTNMAKWTLHIATALRPTQCLQTGNSLGEQFTKPWWVCISAVVWQLFSLSLSLWNNLLIIILIDHLVLSNVRKLWKAHLIFSAPRVIFWIACFSRSKKQILIYNDIKQRKAANPPIMCLASLLLKWLQHAEDVSHWNNFLSTKVKVSALAPTPA